MSDSTERTLQDLLSARGLTMEAAAVLAQVDTSTISRICAGRTRATPQTVVRLSRALRVGSRRMARLCDQAWQDRAQRTLSEKSEELRAMDIDAMGGNR